MSRGRIAVLIVGVALVSPPLAGANLLVNGDFESQPNWGASNGSGCGTGKDTGCSVLVGSQLPGWTIEAGHAVTVHNLGTYPTISGTYSVNTDGEGLGGHNANFYQDFGTLVGQPYMLQFDWAGWFSNSTPHLDVTVTDTVTAAVLYHGNVAWASGTQHVSATFVGTGNPLRLRIQESPESGSNDDTFMVDNFDVEGAAAPLAQVPVPALDRAMLALLAAALLLAGLATTRLRGRPDR